jgi:hypothetical protein
MALQFVALPAISHLFEQLRWRKFTLPVLLVVNRVQAHSMSQFL